MKNYKSNSRSYRLSRVLCALIACTLLFGTACGEEEKKPPTLSNNSTNNNNNSDENNRDAPGTPSVLPEVLDTHVALREAECEMMYNCCSEEELAQRFGEDVADGECSAERTVLPVGLDLTIISNGVRDGRMELDTEMAELCVETYLAQGCRAWSTVDPFSTKLAGCIEAITPLVELGNACFYDRECKQGSCVQVMDEDGNYLESRVCLEQGQKGDDCFAQGCADGLYCESFSNTCLEKRADGVSCFEDSECKSGSCVTTANGDMQCLPASPICSSGI